MNVEHWPKLLLNEIEWFQLGGILEHADFNAKDDIMNFHSLLKSFHLFLIRLCKDGGLNAKVMTEYRIFYRTIAMYD